MSIKAQIGNVRFRDADGNEKEFSAFGGGGDMFKATYDAKNKQKQVAFEDEVMPLDNGVIEDANTFTHTGFAKTARDFTANLPAEVMGKSGSYGVIAAMIENETNGTGAQIYIPASGSNAARLYLRSVKDTNISWAESVYGEWTKVATMTDLETALGGLDAAVLHLEEVTGIE